MRKEAVVESIQINYLGEFRMGCDSYGLTITTNFGVIETFSDIQILIGQSDYSKIVEQSACKRYLLIKGAFATYIVDIKDQSISVYRATVRGIDDEWSEENAIYGKETHHIRGFSRHYHLQFPFVRKDNFHQVFCEYESLRRRQMQELTGAL